jgi:tetratricopeptide (TPR) repeat protein
MEQHTAIEDLQAKIDALNQEAWSIRVSDSAQTFLLSSEAAALAKRCGYQKGLAEALRTKSFALIRTSKLNEAKSLLDEALPLFENVGDERGKSDVFEFYGIIFRSYGSFDASLETLYRSLELRVKTAYQEGVALSQYHLGVTYKYLGNYEKALCYLLQSLAAAREIKYRVAESYSLNLIGQIYFETADFEQSLDYYQQSLHIRKSTGDLLGEAGCRDNIGYTYYKLGDVDRAIQHCTESLTISRGTGDKKGQANALFHLGELFQQNGQEESALRACQESLLIRRSLNDKKGQAEVLLLLDSVVPDSAATPADSWPHLAEALQLANEIKSKDLLAKVHFTFYNCFKRMGEYQRALESFEMFNKIEKELHKDALAEKIVNLEITHRVEQAKKEAEAYRQRNDELAALYKELKKQKEITEQQKLVAETSLQQLRETQAQLVQKKKWLPWVNSLQALHTKFKTH